MKYVGFLPAFCGEIIRLSKGWNLIGVTENVNIRDIIDGKPVELI